MLMQEELHLGNRCLTLVVTHCFALTNVRVQLATQSYCLQNGKGLSRVGIDGKTVKNYPCKNTLPTSLSISPQPHLPELPREPSQRLAKLTYKRDIARGLVLHP